MPVPDLARPTRVDAKAAVHKVATAATPVTMLTPLVNQIYRIRSVAIANPNAAAVTAKLSIVRATVDYWLAPNVTVPINAVYSAMNSDEAAYMEYGDVLAVSASATGVTFHVSYEVIS